MVSIQKGEISTKEVQYVISSTKLMKDRQNSHSQQQRYRKQEDRHAMQQLQQRRHAATQEARHALQQLLTLSKQDRLDSFESFGCLKCG